MEENIEFNWPEEAKSLFVKFSVNKEGQFKIVIGGYKLNEHLTIGFYENSQTVDVHLKNDSTGIYTSLFKMNYKRFLVMVRNIGLYQQDLFSYFIFSNKINPGRLGKYKLWMHHQDKMDEKHQDLIKLQRNKTKLKLNTNKNIFELWEDFEPAQNIKNYKSGLAYLYDSDLKLQGFLYKFEGVGTYFFKKKDWNKMSRLIIEQSYYYLQNQKFDRKEYVLNHMKTVIGEKYPSALKRIEKIEALNIAHSTNK